MLEWQYLFFEVLDGHIKREDAVFNIMLQGKVFLLELNTKKGSLACSIYNHLCFFVINRASIYNRLY
jgi:hypothetical protein